MLALTSAVSAVAAPLSAHPVATHAPAKHAPARAKHVVKHAKPRHKAKAHPKAKKPVPHPLTSTALPAAAAAPARIPLPIAPLPLPVMARSASPTPSASPAANPSASPTVSPSASPSPAASTPSAASPAPTSTVTGASMSPSASASPAVTASAATTANQIAIGVTVAADDDASDVNAYTSAAGRNPAILMWYSNWAGPLAYGSQVGESDSVGATPMVTWDPTDINGNGIPLDDIANGDYDGYIDSSAARAVAYGKPVLIRFAHEMNLAGSPYGPGNAGDSATSFVAAWQRVVARFSADGARNVRWVWSPNVDCGGGCPFTSFYPGDNWVDYVALDGYNYSTVHKIAPQSFTQVFGSSYAELRQLSTKPAMIAETATVGSPTDKAAWITDAFTAAIPASFPGLVAVIWFDRNKEYDWRVNADAPTLTAWQNVVNNPAYQGTLSW